MNPQPLSRRSTAVALLATIAVTSLAPAAHAGHGDGWFYKVRRAESPSCGGGHVVAVRERTVYAPSGGFQFHARSEGGGGGVLAGLIGGIAIGAILSNAAHSHPAAPPPPAEECRAPERECHGSDGGYSSRDDMYTPPESDYSYEDPYCRERFASLDLYMAHAERHAHHALVCNVIDGRDGDVVDVIRYDGNHWVTCGPDGSYDRDDEDDGDE